MTTSENISAGMRYSHLRRKMTVALKELNSRHRAVAPKPRVITTGTGERVKIDHFAWKLHEILKLVEQVKRI